MASSPLAPGGIVRRKKKKKNRKPVNKDSKFLALVQMRDRNSFEKKYELAERVLFVCFTTPLQTGGKGRLKRGKKRSYRLHTVSHPQNKAPAYQMRVGITGFPPNLGGSRKILFLTSRL